MKKIMTTLLVLAVSLLCSGLSAQGEDDESRVKGGERFIKGPESPEIHWTPAETALKQAIAQSPKLGQLESVAMWLRFLQRSDIDDGMRVFGTWRIGSIYAYNFDVSRGEKPDSQQAAVWLSKVRTTAPELVSNETINATTVYGTLSGNPLEQAERLAEAYRWLATRNDDVFRSSAKRINALGYVIDAKFYPQLTGRDVPSAETQLQRVSARIDEARSGMEERITSQIEYSQDPVAISRLLKAIEDIAPPELLKKWRQMAADPEKAIGLQAMLDERVQNIEKMSKQEFTLVHDGGPNNAPKVQLDRRQDDTSAAKAVRFWWPSGLWLLLMPAGVVLWLWKRTKSKSS